MDLRTAVAISLQSARVAHFAGQQFSLPWLERLITGQSREPLENAAEIRRLAFQELNKLIRRDAENIARGLVPWEVLRPESPTTHWVRFAKILADGVRLSKRRRDQSAHDFPDVTDEDLAEVPEYYRRNFHFQTGGYLTAESAELYEHQVEILFAGGGDAMRRLILAPLKEIWPNQGEGLRFLEVGAGTGRLSRFMKLAFPKARITVTDLSWAYLKAAQKRLREFDRLEFLQAAAEDLPFSAGQFDLVASCFLFHELPAPVRKQVMSESMRVLKPGGVAGVVDSLQLGDLAGFDPVLLQFPRDFHEPFYRNYLQTPLDALMSEAGFVDLTKDQGFLSKAVLGRKPMDSVSI